ncbi:MAG: bifunctional aspartate kinase/homoserine dehydrogenase I [Myxococcales bacterium]
MNLQIFKFGGTSMGSAEALRLAFARIQEARPRPVAVVSAMSGVTDLLLGAARSALKGDSEAVKAAVDAFRGKHLSLIAELVPRRGARAALEAVVEESAGELAAICESIRVLRELTPRTLDAVAARGERVVARVFSEFLVERGVSAAYVDATEILFTERTLDSLWPDLGRCEKEARKRLMPLLKAGKVVIVPGFIATGPDGQVVTLGRGGSDFSASLLARSLGAQKVTLWKEVDGLMTADPKAVADARVLPELHYREAAELAYYGAKVLHPRTMVPLIDRKIPLFLRNSFNPSFSGTRIAGDVGAGDYPVKALTAIHAQALISVEGKGMLGVPGIAARTFGALSQAGHSVSMISQASSEASICFVVPAAEADDAVRALNKAFAAEIEGKFIDAVKVERPVSLIAVVGLGMAGKPGIASRTTAPLARDKVNIRAIAQGSSELNITFAVKEPDAARALKALHAEFQLDKQRPLAETHGRGASVVLFGAGQIGRALARQLIHQETYFRHDLGLNVGVVAACDRSGFVAEEKGFSREALEALLERKESGRPLVGKKKMADLAESDLKKRGPEMVKSLGALPLPNPVFVDVTAVDDAAIVRQALERGFHVVLANKKPLVAPQKEFEALFQIARERGLSLRYEATVGAGLPVLDTLKKLQEAGDRIHTVVGALSGTLGYLMTQLDEGVAFSEAVRTAHQLGYTEPDPKDDLSGMDVARKALILARTIGMKAELADVAVEPLFPASMAKLSAAEFLARVGELDAEFAQKVAENKRQKKVLRYVARIEKSGLRVGLEAVSEASPTGRLKGPDNQVVLYTDRYKANPLVVTGPGAGAEVTAAGVLNDILAIATAAQAGPSTALRVGSR